MFRKRLKNLRLIFRCIFICRGERTAAERGDPKTPDVSWAAILPEQVILQILHFLDDHDRIALAYSCERIRRVFQDNPSLMRKANLSKCIAKRQQSTIKDFLRDKQMLQHIREFNLNNQRLRDGQTDIDIEQFVIKICPQLEALHVMNCGLSLKTLHRILQRAPKLTTFSFSITDLSREDVQFMMLETEVARNGFRLGNIRKLHIEGLFALTHFRILKYLVLSCCKFLEELDISIWDVPRTSELVTHWILGDAGFLHQQSAEPFEHFHSLTMRTVDLNNNDLRSNASAESELNEFIISVVKKKSRKMNWKKFWISPLNVNLLNQDEDLFSLSSVEAFAANDVFEEDKLKALFPKINDGVVRKLLLRNIKHVCQFHKSIARIGGDTLQSLSLSRICEFCELDVQPRLLLNPLFSACSNIRELNLLSCHFVENICESLSKLKHLVRIQLQQCAIAPDHSKQVMDKGHVKMLTFVETCPNVKDFDVRGCAIRQCHSSRYLVNDDLLPIAKWIKLESLTCCSVELKTEQDNQKAVTEQKRRNGFLRNVTKNCKFLETLRIAIDGNDDEPYFASLEYARQLKHLGLDYRVGLYSDDLWKLLSCMTNLERVCIASFNEEALNVSLEMVRNLPRLHVLHLHLNGVKNAKTFHKQIMKTLEKENSDPLFHFEFHVEEDWLKNLEQPRTDKDVLPLNISELCIFTPHMELQSV